MAWTAKVAGRVRGNLSVAEGSHRLLPSSTDERQALELLDGSNLAYLPAEHAGDRLDIAPDAGVGCALVK